jgi:hypothetical protein
MQDGKHLRGLACLWGCLTLASGAARADEAREKPPTFLVTDIVVDEGVAIDKEQARNVLASRFGRLRDKIEVRSFADVKTTLDQGALNQMTGSDQPDTALANINTYLDVDRLVFGHISKVGGVTEVQVRIFNAREGNTELTLARRMKPDAPPQLVLTLLDSLADGLLAYVLDTYTDAKPSAQYNALAAKKLHHDDPAAAPAEAGPKRAGSLGVIGAAVVGAGVGTMGAGSVALGFGSLDDADTTKAGLLILAGGSAALVGSAALLVDAFLLE